MVWRPDVDGAGRVVWTVSKAPDGVTSWTVTVTAGTETVPPLEVVTVTVG
jgi:hypothetical protein